MVNLIEKWYEYGLSFLGLVEIDGFVKQQCSSEKIWAHHQEMRHKMDLIKFNINYNMTKLK